MLEGGWHSGTELAKMAATGMLLSVNSTNDSSFCVLSFCGTDSQNYAGQEESGYPTCRGNVYTANSWTKWCSCRSQLEP